MAFAKSQRRAEVVAAAPWDLVIVDEAHHCKNRATRNWQLVNSLNRRHLFLLTATPVQNNLLELYNLLTLLEPGHLKTESDFKRQYVRRGNPRDPRNRERLRSLLGEVMVRNTRSLVHIDLPPRYAQTLMAQPHGDEQALYRLLDEYLRQRQVLPGDDGSEADDAAARKRRPCAKHPEGRSGKWGLSRFPPRRPAAAGTQATQHAAGGLGQPSALAGPVAGKGGRRRSPRRADHCLGPGCPALGQGRQAAGAVGPGPRREGARLRQFPADLGAPPAAAGRGGHCLRHLLRRRVGPAEGRGGRGLPPAGPRHALLRDAAARAATCNSPIP